MVAIVAGIQVGQVRTEGESEAIDSMDRKWKTGFYKFPVTGSVNIHYLGVGDDEIADLKNHGGVDKAILAYSADHYPTWIGELHTDDFQMPQHEECNLGAFGFGAFAENLTIQGLTEENVCIGDRFAVGDVGGDASGVPILLEVSQPRQPCWKISRRWRNRTLTKQVGKTGRTGWYLRVLREGRMTVGDVMTLNSRPHPDWTIRRANDLLMGREADRHALKELMALPELAKSWKQSLA